MYTTGEGNTPSQETKRAGKIDEAPSFHDYRPDTDSLGRLKHRASGESVQIGLGHGVNPIPYIHDDIIPLA